MRMPIVGYVGMTHLGLNSAVAAADRGFELICYDADQKLIDELNCFELPVNELDLPELLQKYADQIKFTADINVLSVCDLVYIAPDVPTDEHGLSDLHKIDELIRHVDTIL